MDQRCFEFMVGCMERNEMEERGAFTGGEYRDSVLTSALSEGKRCSCIPHIDVD